MLLSHHQAIHIFDSLTKIPGLFKEFPGSQSNFSRTLHRTFQQQIVRAVWGKQLMTKGTNQNIDFWSTQFTCLHGLSHCHFQSSFIFVSANGVHHFLKLKIVLTTINWKFRITFMSNYLNIIFSFLNFPSIVSNSRDCFHRHSLYLICFPLFFFTQES